MRDRSFLLAITVMILSCAALLTAPLLNMEGVYGAPSAVQRERLPSLRVVTVHGAIPLEQALDGPGILLLAGEDARSVSMIAAWEGELRRLRRHARAREVIDPQLFVVRFGACRPSVSDGMYILCADPTARMTLELPSRFVLGPGREIRGFAYERSNFAIPPFATTARTIWAMARSRTRFELIDQVERRSY